MLKKHGDGMKLNLSRAVDGIQGTHPPQWRQLTFRNGWGATIVDGLTTLLVAGLEEEVLQALNYVIAIDFTKPDGLVDPFETIIRYRQ